MNIIQLNPISDSATFTHIEMVVADNSSVTCLMSHEVAHSFDMSNPRGVLVTLWGPYAAQTSRFLQHRQVNHVLIVFNRV